MRFSLASPFHCPCEATPAPSTLACAGVGLPARVRDLFSLFLFLSRSVRIFDSKLCMYTARTRNAHVHAHLPRGVSLLFFLDVFLVLFRGSIGSFTRLYPLGLLPYVGNG